MQQNHQEKHYHGVYKSKQQNYQEKHNKEIYTLTQQNYREKRNLRMNGNKAIY